MNHAMDWFPRNIDDISRHSKDRHTHCSVLIFFWGGGGYTCRTSEVTCYLLITTTEKNLTKLELWKLYLLNMAAVEFVPAHSNKLLF